MGEEISCNGREPVFNQSTEGEETSQLEFLDKYAESYNAKTWQGASPKEKVKLLIEIASSHDEERAYVITEDEKDLMELGKGLGTMRGIVKKILTPKPEILWGGLKEKMYTDSHIIIMDKEVSEKLLWQELDNYKKRTLKSYCKNLELDRFDAFKRLSSEIIDNIENGSLNNLNYFRDNLGEIIERLENENTVELKERGFVPGSLVVFSDLEKQKFVSIDGRYYAGLKKEFPKAKFFCNFDYPVVGLREEEELKAIILPIVVLGSYLSYDNFVKKVRGE